MPAGTRPRDADVHAQCAFWRAAHATATQYIYLHDLAAFWDEIKDKVKAEWGPEKMPYGMMESAIKDPDGYLLSFGEELEKSGQGEY